MKYFLKLNMKTARQVFNFASFELCATYIYAHILELLSKC